MPKVAIIVLNYKVGNDTVECLESLYNVLINERSEYNLAKDNFQLLCVVIDNNSGDRSVDLIKNFIAKTVGEAKSKKIDVEFIENKENLGYSGGNNVGIAYALKNGADFVLILNPDTYVDKNLILELLKVGEKEDVGIVVPKIYFAPGFEFHKDRYSEKDRGRVIWYAGGIVDWNNVMGKHRGVDEVDHGQYDRIEETNFASGACMLVKREVLERVGPFDKKYFLYYEDSDLSVRVKKADYKIMFAPRAILWHKNAASAGGSGSPLQDYYITRNRLLFGFRYAPIRSKISLFRESIRQLLSGREWQRKGTVDFYLRRFGKGSFNPA